MRHYQVELINFDKPNGYRLVALVDAENAIEANKKAQEQNPGLLAISAELYYESE